MQFNFIFCPQTREKKKKKKWQICQEQDAPFLVLCQVLLLPAQQENTAAASALHLWAHKVF